MSKKSIYLISFVLVLGLASNASADPNLVAYYRLDGDARDTGATSLRQPTAAYMATRPGQLGV